ncbi:class I SAM-dependent methyltransferase [Delftia lacustris]|jgi:ubiquinone/menaquinone biosynthesis C-methylase UbiE|uniref:class I SAM-dependent methyltransferase n=1 Tax=Delftia TaxID=80865 RepID=UPI001FCC8190|nr:class I SAM-dependent methyltransferase [Delftia lacustris]
MKDYSLKSGERYSTLDLNLIGGDHLLRYRYAANRAKEIYPRPYGADIFCGSGYGAEILASTTQGSILAIDGSTEAIENANKKIHDPNIIWAAKLFPFNLPKETFDFITSMESLEHVKDFEAFFWVLSQSLKSGGTLFISSPHEEIMPYTGYIWHYKHFLPEEIRSLARQNNLMEINAFSTNSSIFKDGKSCLFYPFQMGNDQPVDLEKGDTLFFEFRKN